MSVNWHSVLIWISGFFCGWLALWHFLVRPMARQLGLTRDRPDTSAGSS